MPTILPKSQMSEEDIKLNYITPALLGRGWKNRITMETGLKFTDGKINLRVTSLQGKSQRKRIIYSTLNGIILLRL